MRKYKRVRRVQVGMDLIAEMVKNGVGIARVSVGLPKTAKFLGSTLDINNPNSVTLYFYDKSFSVVEEAELIPIQEVELMRIV